MKCISKTIAALLLSTVVTSASSQTFIRTVDGKNYWTDLKAEKFSNTEEISVNDGRRVVLLPLSDILLYEDLETGLKIIQPNKLKIVDPIAFNGDLTSFFAQGKRVYIPLASQFTQQRWGARRLNELLSESNYWQVVGCEKEADFILEYVFDESGKDHAYLIITDRMGKGVLSTSSVGATDFVPAHAGIESAEKLFKLFFTKRIFKGKIEDFKAVKEPNKKSNYCQYYAKFIR